MRKTRVKFKMKDSDMIQIGYLKKDKKFTSGFKVITSKISIDVNQLVMIEKI